MNSSLTYNCSHSIFWRLIWIKLYRFTKIFNLTCIGGCVIFFFLRLKFNLFNFSIIIIYSIAICIATAIVIIIGVLHSYFLIFFFLKNSIRFRLFYIHFLLNKKSFDIFFILCLINLFSWIFDLLLKIIVITINLSLGLKFFIGYLRKCFLFRLFIFFFLILFFNKF